MTLVLHQIVRLPRRVRIRVLQILLPAAGAAVTMQNATTVIQCASNNTMPDSIYSTIPASTMSDTMLRYSAMPVSILYSAVLFDIRNVSTKPPLIINTLNLVYTIRRYMVDSNLFVCLRGQGWRLKVRFLIGLNLTFDTMLFEGFSSYILPVQQKELFNQMLLCVSSSMMALVWLPLVCPVRT